MKELQLNQELFYYPTGRSKAKCVVTVTKLGRKWCTLSNGVRFDRSEDIELGRGVPTEDLRGRVWVSQVAHDEWRRFNQLAAQLRQYFRDGDYHELSLAKMEAIAQLTIN